jgi:hypothetical protein
MKYKQNNSAGTFLSRPAQYSPEDRYISSLANFIIISAVNSKNYFIYITARLQTPIWKIKKAVMCTQK